MERGSNFSEEEVPRETIEHIFSAGCKGQSEVVTLAHNNPFRDLMFDVTRHQSATSDREFTTLGSEKTLDKYVLQQGFPTRLEIGADLLG